MKNKVFKDQKLQTFTYLPQLDRLYYLPFTPSKPNSDPRHMNRNTLGKALSHLRKALFQGIIIYISLSLWMVKFTNPILSNHIDNQYSFLHLDNLYFSKRSDQGYFHLFDKANTKPLPQVPVVLHMCNIAFLPGPSGFVASPFKQFIGMFFEKFMGFEVNIIIHHVGLEQVDFMKFLLLTSKTAMNQRAGQLNTNQINLAQQNLVSSSNLPISQSGIITSFQSHQPYNNPNQALQTIVPMGADTASEGILYYTDLDKQTCTDIKTFVKEPREKHICILIANLLFLTSVIIVIILINILDLPALAGQILMPYWIYIFFSLDHSLWPHFGNMKNYSHIQNTYQQMQQSTGHIKLYANCYHFTSNNQEIIKVNTHTATKMFPLRECTDIGQPFENLKQNNKYLFYKIRNYFCFSDRNSHKAFLHAFRVFQTNNNMPDQHQEYTHSLDVTIPDFQTEIALDLEGTGGCLKPGYVFFMLIGLAYPYLLMIQCLSQRYSINVIKRVAI